MNRKVLAIALVVMCLAMLATSLVGAAQACVVKNRITREYYSIQYVMTQIQAPNPPVIKGDCKIISGTISQGAYSSPLGTGTMTGELKTFVINTVKGTGWQYATNTIAITSGPYGSGTLTGYSWFTFDSVALPLTSSRGGTFLSGMLGGHHVTIMAEKGFNMAVGVWEKGWIIVS